MLYLVRRCTGRGVRAAVAAPPHPTDETSALDNDSHSAHSHTIACRLTRTRLAVSVTTGRIPSSFVLLLLQLRRLAPHRDSEHTRYRRYTAHSDSTSPNKGTPYSTGQYFNPGHGAEAPARYRQTVTQDPNSETHRSTPLTARGGYCGGR